MACFKCICFKGQQDEVTDDNYKATDSPFENQTRNETKVSELKLFYNDVLYSLNGNLKTTYIDEKGFFYHTIVYEAHQMVPDSVCYSGLSLRETDQLLDVADNDVTLMSHDEVLKLIKQLPVDEEISMLISREDPDDKMSVFIIDIMFKFMISKVDDQEKLIAVVSSTHTHDVDWHPKDRTVVMNKISTQLYLQLKKDTNDVLIFDKLISDEPKPICHFVECHFIEERSIVRTPQIHFHRQYKSQKNSNSMFVKPDGYLMLIPAAETNSVPSPTVFELKRDYHQSFMVLVVADTSRAMKIESSEGWFVGTNIKPIGNVDQDFRFDIFPIKCK